MPFDTVELGITVLQQQMHQSCQAEELSLYLPLLGKRFASSEVATEDLETSVSDFVSNANPKRVCALFGDGGSGKSVFLKKFTLKLWDEYEFGKPIPLFISLPLLNDPIHSVIEETLLKIGFDEKQIAELKTNHSFIFILDGYDEIHQLQNLYVSNGLSEWNAKTIISCRSQYLYNKENANLYFMPLENEREQAHLLQTLYVAPFNQDQIRHYFELSRNTNISIPDDEAIEMIPGLRDLITSPFLLKLAVEALPDILARYANASQQERQQLTQTDLYKSFVSRWFERQEKKLKDSGRITEDMPDQKPIFWRYCQSLALEMHKHNLSWLSAEDEKFSVYFENDAETEILRSACPIRRIEGKIGFWHESLGAHFVAQTIYQESLHEKVISMPQQVTASAMIEKTETEERPRGTIHLRLITDDPTALHNLADEVNRDERYKAWLFDIIDQSKNNEYYAVGAANAITTLNYARISLSNKDFSHTKLNGADLTSVVAHKSNFNHADLSNTTLSSGYFAEACFNQANFFNTKFGQLPHFSWKYGSVYSLCFSPDGNCLVVGGALGMLSLFDMTSHRFIAQLNGHQGNVYSVAVSPNGKYCISASRDHTIRWWDLRKNTSIVLYDFSSEDTLNLAYDQEFPLAFSPNGQFFSFSQEGMYGFYKLYIATCPSTAFYMDSYILTEGGGHISDIAYSNTMIAFCVKNGYQNQYRIELWDLNKKEKINTFEDSYHCVFSSDENLLAMAYWIKETNEHSIRIYDVRKKQFILDLKRGVHALGHHAYGEAIRTLAFSQDGEILASGGKDHLIFLWDILNEGRLLTTLVGHDDAVMICCFTKHNDKLLLASGSGQEGITGRNVGDQMIKLWDISTILAQKNDVQLSATNHLGDINRLAILPSRFVISGGRDSHIKLWSLSDGKHLHTFHFYEKRDDSGIMGCCVLPKHQKVIICDGSKEIKYLDLKTHRIYKAFDRDASDTRRNVDAIVSHNEKIFVSHGASYGAQGNLSAYSLSTGKLLYCLHIAAYRPTFSFDVEKVFLAVIDNKNYIRVYNAENGEEEMFFHVDGYRIHDIAFSAQNKFLLTSIQSQASASIKGKGSVKLWDIKRKICTDTFDTDGEEDRLVKFSPNGKYLFIVNHNGTLRVLDIQEKIQIGSFQISDNRESYHASLEFLDNIHFITVSGDNVIKSWSFHINEKNQADIQLLWRTSGDCVVNQATFYEAKNLSHLNKELLEQKNAKIKENNFVLITENTTWEQLSQQDGAGRTRLHWAVKENDLILIESILNRYACLQYELGKLLFSSGENLELISQSLYTDLVTIKDHQGMTPLELAFVEEKIGAMKLMLESLAFEENHVSMRLQALGSCGIYRHNSYDWFNKYMRNSGSVLHVAGEPGDQYIKIKQLVSEKASVKFRESQFGCTPLIIAAGRGNLKILQYLLENGASISERNKFGAGAIHAASQKGQFHVVRWLVENKICEADEKHAYGTTPSNIALAFGYAQIAQWLERNTLNSRTDMHLLSQQSLMSETASNSKVVQQENKSKISKSGGWAKGFLNK